MHILWVIIIGFVAGLIARLLAPGSNNLAAGFILTTLLGIAGAFVATFIGQAIGWYRADQGAGLTGASSARRSSCLCGTASFRRALSQTPAAAVGSRLHHRAPRRFSLDDDRTRSASAAGNRQQIVIARPPHFQHGPLCFLRRDRHQGGNDLDLGFEILAEPLCRECRVVDGRRIAPHAPPAVLGIPHLTHTAPLPRRIPFAADYQYFTAPQQVHCAVHSRSC